MLGPSSPRIFVLLAVLTTLGACSDSSLDLPSQGIGGDDGIELNPMVAFEAAEIATGVPAELLMAISKAETSLQWVRGEEEFPGQPIGYGVMGLREVELGAALAEIDPEDARDERDANVLAAAHVLARYADELDVDTTDLDAWAPAVALYSGITSPEAAAQYVHDQVYRALGTGIEIEGVRVPPIAVAPKFPEPERYRGVSPIWTPTPNYNSRYGAAVDYVVIHTCEGSYSGCWGWLTNPSAGASAHYVVKEDGTEVRQLVSESNRAWHVAADYDCDNNHGVDCGRDGTSVNTISVGIEHAGYASQSSWDSGLLQTSAELTCGITQRHGIPTDSYHIVGHGQLQPWNRSDPGANWPWSNYLDRVKSACGGSSSGGSSSGGGTGGAPSSAPAGTPSGPQRIIDSNQNANDPSSHYVEVGTGWWASTNVSGYWNTGYWVAPTSPTSDPASFWFYADKASCYTVEAWWTAAWDRHTEVTFLGWDIDEREAGRASVDQTRNGSRWNHLGGWTFPAGWNRVVLSRWADPGAYVVADAVRVTEGCP